MKNTALGTSLVLFGNITTAKAAPTNEEITHYVLFWLKKDLGEEKIKEFTAFFELLKTIPVVKSLKFGRAAKTNKREVVDNSFTYNLIVTFEDLKAISTYETHPIHLDAVKKFSHFWDKVVVHDSCVG